MAKVAYSKLGLKLNTETKTFIFNDKEIEVLKYLPIEDKYDLITIALQKAEQDGIYNELLLDMYFHLYLVYMYSNLNFTEKQRENESKLYDALMSNGFFDKFLDTIEESEYSYLFEMMTAIKEEKMEYLTTAGALVQKIITDLPANAEKVSAILDEFDPEKFKQVQNLIDYSKAAGNRS